jgi:glycosyltransferase involved in cell wall biosynthesis
VTTVGKKAGTEDAVQVAVLVHHPAQQFTQGFRLLANSPELRVRTYFWDAAREGMFDPGFGRHVRWQANLHSGYDWWSPPRTVLGLRRWSAILRQLRHDRPEVMVCYGWGCAIVRVGILFGRITRTPLLYYADSNRRTSGGWRAGLRGLALRFILRSAAGAISIGAANRDFYLAHGLRPDLIHSGVLPADVEAFATAADGRRARDHAAGADRPLIIGFAGKFLAIKAADDLIEAAARLPRDRRWELWLVGDGAERSRLESLVTRRGLAERVRFLGFRNTDEMPDLIAAMDMLVMPSRREPRGLVAVEAMAAGVATIVSSATGVWGPGDLVQHEHTGLVYPVGNIPALTSWLRRLLEDHAFRRALAARGQARALACGPQDFATTTTAALVATARSRDRVARH